MKKSDREKLADSISKYGVMFNISRREAANIIIRSVEKMERKNKWYTPLSPLERRLRVLDAIKSISDILDSFVKGEEFQIIKNVQRKRGKRII